MFGSNKKATVVHTSVASDNVETLIGKTTSLTGTLSSDGSIRIEGVFEGNILSKGDVFVGPSSKVKADLNARNITVSGDVSGNISVVEKLELLSGACLHGDIKVKKLVIEEGAIFKGNSETREDNARQNSVASVVPVPAKQA